MQSGGNVVGNGQDTGKSGFDRNALPHETPDRPRGVGSRLLGAIMWPWGWVKNITSRSAGAPTSSAASSALMVCALRSMDACTHELFWAGSQGQGEGSPPPRGRDSPCRRASDVTGQPGTGRDGSCGEELGGQEGEVGHQDSHHFLIRSRPRSNLQLDQTIIQGRRASTPRFCKQVGRRVHIQETW